MDYNKVEKKYIIVDHPLKVYHLEKYLESYDTFSFDTETTGLNVRKDKVIGFSISGKVGTAYYVPLKTWCTKTEQLISTCITGVQFKSYLETLARKELLMWNASYDIRIVKNHIGIDLSTALLADIMLMKHTVEEDGDFALKKVAIQYQAEIGLDVEEEANKEQIELKENIKKNGGSTTQANYEMYKADLEVMGKYACADADLTLRLAHFFREKLEAEGLEDYFYDEEVMPLYKEVTIKMEEKGIHLDMELMQNTRENIIKDMSELEDDIVHSLLEVNGAEAWLRNTMEEKVPMKKGGKFGQEVIDYYGLKLPKSEKTGKYQTGKKLVEKLPDSPAKLYLLGDDDALESHVTEAIRMKLWKEENGNVININSKTQMGDLVFNYMGVTPLSYTDGGQGQFNDTMIQKLVDDGHEWADKLSTYNKLLKIKGTYIDRFLDAQEGGIFYPSFYQHRTISGRYGSDMQQLNRPKEEGELPPLALKYNNMIRKFFISGPDRMFVDSDYESLEPHVFAHVSGDDGLRNIFRKGHDFYSTIAIATEGLKGVSADKKSPDYLGSLNKPLRQKAKAYSLGVPYGMKSYALGMTLGVSQEEAERLISGYLDGFPELKKWMKESEYMAKTLGYVKSEVGRIRHLPKVKELYKKHGDKLLDFKYRTKLQKKYGKEEVTKMYNDYKNGLNNAKNFQIQSLSASIVNLSAIQINRELIKRGIDGWVALQIHDQLVVDVPKNRAEECRELVQEIMENTYKLSLELKAPAELANNLYEGH